MLYDQVLQMFQYVKDELGDFDSVYESAIIQLVGEYGLRILMDHRLIETCGVVNGRQLYALD